MFLISMCDLIIRYYFEVSILVIVFDVISKESNKLITFINMFIPSNLLSRQPLTPLRHLNLLKFILRIRTNTDITHKLLCDIQPPLFLRQTITIILITPFYHRTHLPYCLFLIIGFIESFWVDDISHLEYS